MAGDRLSISAPTSLTDVIADERVRTWFPALVEAASTVGSVQIRNRASLTGNICNASPAYDTATALLVHDAEIVLGSRAGTRRVPVRDFVLGPRSTDLRPGEIATAVELPVPGERLGTTFARLTRRRGRRPRHPQPVLRRRRSAGPGSPSARWRPARSSSTTTAACSPTPGASAADRERRAAVDDRAGPAHQRRPRRTRTTGRRCCWS